MSQCHEQEKDQKGQHSWVKPGYYLVRDRGDFGLCPESRACVTELSCTLSLTLEFRRSRLQGAGKKEAGHALEKRCMQGGYCPQNVLHVVVWLVYSLWTRFVSAQDRMQENGGSFM